MKKLLIISMLGLGLGLGLLAQANEQERELHASTQVDTQAGLAATDTAEQVATKNENGTSETVESAAAELKPHPKKNKSNKASSSSLASQYLAGFAFGSATGAACRFVGGKDNGNGVLAWIGEYLVRNSILDVIDRDMKRYQQAELSEGTYSMARLGSWIGYFAASYFLISSELAALKASKAKRV
jgi:hypothetical protein